MIQSIYTSVSNADIVPCGKKGQSIKSDPIPLLRNNYLGEYRTELEKAKVRKNLGIADEATLQWGNIFGFIEKQTDLVDYIKTMQEYSTSLTDQVTNVREALDYVIEFVTTFKIDNNSIQQLKQDVLRINSDLDILNQSIRSVNRELQNNINTLEQSIQQDINNVNEQINQTIQSIEADLRSGIAINVEAIGDVSRSIEEINQKIEQINQDLIYIDVDANILTWMQNKLLNSNSIELTENELQVKISNKEKNAIQFEDGLYVEDLSEDIITYKTDLSDDTKAPATVGGITEGTKVSELRNKTFSEIIDTILFPTAVRPLEYPTLQYKTIPSLVEVGSPLIFPEVIYYPGDAGKIIEQTNQLFNPSNIIITEGVYKQVGTYTYKAIVKYESGEYLINNKGEITNTRVEAGSITDVASINATYPWYTSSKKSNLPELKQQLVKFGKSGEIEFSLTGQAQIWLPGNNSTIDSFTVNIGLGDYMNVNMEGWSEQPEIISYNGINYKVWTKQDEYPAILSHKIKFTLAL